jgi:phosphate:Na+ symporter
MGILHYFDNNKTLRRLAVLLVLTIVLIAAEPAFAAEGGKSLSWGKMAMQLFGGLALFLFGMDQMGEALKEVAGDRLKDILGKLTTNRVMGVVTGAGVTAVIQSSSVTTVMLVGFVSANVMTLSQAIGVILGADIGTTITAQIVAFPVKKYALVLVTGGFLMLFVSKREQIKRYGALVMGLGLVFFGMLIMGDAMKPLRSYEPFIALMQNVSNPVIGILVATAFTALIQSSSATTGIIIVMASQGLVSLEGGIALALGANIGTCATAGLAAIGKPREAVRVAVAHVTFKILGVAIMVWFIPWFAELARMISPVSEELTGTAQLAADTPRQIANAHTMFNVFITILFLPFATQFARLCEWIVPLKKVTVEEEAMEKFRPRHLDDLLIKSPPIALSMVRREISRIGQVVEEMVSAIPEGVYLGKVDKMERVRDMDDQVDSLYAAVARYLARLGRENLSDRDSREAFSLATANTEIENIGDIVETHMYHLTTVCSKNDIVFAEQEMESLRFYHAKVFDCFKLAMVAVEHDRRESAESVIEQEDEIVGGMDRLMEQRQARFMSEDHTPQEMAAFTLETDIMENLKRMYEHSKRIARLVTRQEFSTALVAMPEE